MLAPWSVNGARGLAGKGPMAKICTLCNEDCGSRPRVKDQRGRYFCKACLDTRSASDRRTDPAPAAPSPGEDAYDLDDADPGASPLPIEFLDHVEQSTQCPGCMHSMPPGAKVCVSCGYHVERGIQSSTHIERSKGKGGRKYVCRECGYDLTGLRSGVCPECGTRIRLARSEVQEQLERDVLVQAWRKPLIWLAVGFAGMSIAFLIQGLPVMVPIYAVWLGAQVLVGLAVLWMCFNFLGDLGTPLLNLVRLSGIYAMVDLVGMVTGFVPIPIIPWVITLLVYVGLFSDAFETDWQDAILVIVLTGMAKFGLALVAVLYLPSLLASL